ncbi:MAG: MarR family winged helix-turn-helix transcriptional regulator [Pararhodobacter sp.]
MPDSDQPPVEVPVEVPVETGGFLNDYLLFLLAAASTAASAGFHTIARAEGLKVAEWRALACLYDKDGQMVTRLAALALMEQSAMTRVIERLEDRRLVRRGGDARDRRRVRVFLTPEGRKLLQKLIPQARAHEAGLLALMPAAHREAIKPLLAGLLAALPDNPQERRDAN